MKSDFILEFADEFNSNTLDPSKWFPHMLPHWSTLEQSRARYRLNGQRLELHIAQDQPRWREDSDRASNLQTGHWQGQFRYDPSLQVSSHLPPLELYLPHFGYLEVRLRALPVVGYHTALWLIGFDAPHAGEIRLLEIHGGNIFSDHSRIDYGILAWNDPALHDQTVEDWLPINAAEFHDYAIDWTPSHVDFFVDGKHLRRLEQSPQYRMQLMLGLYERPHEIDPTDTNFPKVIEVEYVRGYRRAS